VEWASLALLLTLLVVAAVLMLVLWAIHGGSMSRGGAGEMASDILKRRYVAGEISQIEYD